MAATRKADLMSSAPAWPDDRRITVTDLQAATDRGVRRVQGRGDAGEHLLAEALELERAGAFAVVLESVPADLGSRVSAALRIPTIGIGAGPGCDAQILVWQDMAGLTTGHLPRFVKQYGNLHADLLTAARQYTSEVADGRYPDQAHSYA
jgi:3-methyl-2-oxobutanoate hydroxymethyltransferase